MIQRDACESVMEEAQLAGCCMMGVTSTQVRVNAVSNETKREGWL